MNDKLEINMSETNQAKFSYGTIFKLFRRIKTGPIDIKYIPLALLIWNPEAPHGHVANLKRLH